MSEIKKAQEMDRGPKNPFVSIFTFLFIGLAIFIMLLSTKIGLDSPRKPGPGFFPFLAGMVILIAGIVQTMSKKVLEDNEFKMSVREIKVYISIVILFMIWIFGMQILGHIIATFIATFFLSKIMGLEGWLKPTLLSIGTSVFIYVLFDLWLYIDLPQGILG